MTSSISWIDPKGLAATLQRVNHRAPASQPSRPPLSQGMQSKGIKPAPPGDPVSTETAGLARPLEKYSSPEGALRDRLEAYTKWLTGLSGCRAAFVVDRDGMPLVDHQADVALLAVASSFMRLVERINGKLPKPLGPSITVELDPGLLSLVLVETTLGEYVVGQVGGRPLDPESTRATAEALRETVEPVEFRAPSRTVEPRSAAPQGPPTAAG